MHIAQCYGIKIWSAVTANLYWWHLNHTVIELGSRVFCLRRLPVWDSSCAWLAKAVGSGEHSEKIPVLPVSRMCTSVSIECSEPVWSNGGAELWGFEPVRSFSKGHRSDVGSWDLMESLLIFLVPNNTVAFEGISTCPAWSMRRDMKAGIAQEIKGRLYRRILALSNVHASCSYSLFGDEFILWRKLVEVVILAACKQDLRARIPSSV